MAKRIGLLILIIGCFFAIYAIKNVLAKKPEVAAETPELIEETVVKAPEPEASSKELAPEPSVNTKYSAATLKKISTLKQILTTKNDNDPRLDTELRNLSNEDKDALVGMYQDMKPESLNDKGTVAFLIGREISRPEDAEFLKNILSEEPCLSLENCGITNPQTDPHMDSVNDVTLNYPQIVALNRIKTYLQSHDLQNANPTVMAQLVDAIKVGQNSKSSMIQDRAKDVANLMTPKLTPDLTKAKK